MSPVVWPVNFVAICSGTPARTNPYPRSRRPLLLCSRFPAAGQSLWRSGAGRGEPTRVQVDSAHREAVVPESTCDPVHPRFTGVAFPLTAARTRLRAGRRSWAIAVAAAVIGAATLGAQAPTTEDEIPLATGAMRQPDLESQAGGPDARDTRSIRVYRWTAPTEVLLRFYIRKLGGIRDGALDTASLASLRPGETTPISYRLAFFSLDDQCADPGAGAAAGGAAPAACKVWRRGKDKRRALGGHLGLEPGLWLERATFTWVSRGAQGDLNRWQLELSDVGVSNNWQHWKPLTQLTVERVQLKGSAP
jgi:hypothetical protein